MVVDRRATLGDAAFKPYLLRQAQLARDQREHLRRLQQRASDEAHENEAFWALLQAQPDLDLPDDVLPLVLPSGPQRLSPASLRRRKRYRAHLNRLVAEVLAEPDPDPGGATASPDRPRECNPAWTGPALASDPLAPIASPARLAAADRMAGALCGVCGGGCCTSGGDTAYLSADTLRRVLAQQPQLAPADLAAAYLDQVPAESEVSSCINHTPEGCSLPKTLRSDICNRFECDPLALLQHRQQGALPASHVIIVQRRQNHWNRSRPDLDNPITACWDLTDAGATKLLLPAHPGEVD